MYIYLENKSELIQRKSQEPQCELSYMIANCVYIMANNRYLCLSFSTLIKLIEKHFIYCNYTTVSFLLILNHFYVLRCTITALEKRNKIS